MRKDVVPRYFLARSQMRILTNSRSRTNSLHSTWAHKYKMNTNETFTFLYSEGVFEGQVSDADGKPNGYGVLVYKDDVKYEGQWAEGFENGRGTLTWQDGTTYTGLFCEGKAIDDEVITYVYELVHKRQQVTRMMEEIEDLMEDTQNIALTLDIWQSRFDQLFNIAKEAGVDPAVLVSIRNGTSTVI